MHSDDFIISVRGQFADMMLDGTKDVELRRRPIKIPPRSRVWLYETRPRAYVRLVATVEAVVALPKEQMWLRYGQRIGLSRSRYDDYLAGADVAYGVVIERVEKLGAPQQLSSLRALAPGFQPPQFYARLRAEGGILSVLRQQINRASATVTSEAA